MHYITFFLLCKCKNKYIILCHAIEYSTLCEYIRSAFSNNVVMVYDYYVAYPKVCKYIQSTFPDDNVIVHDINTKFKVDNYISLRRIPILSDSPKPPPPISK